MFIQDFLLIWLNRTKQKKNGFQKNKKNSSKFGNLPLLHYIYIIEFSCRMVLPSRKVRENKLNIRIINFSRVSFLLPTHFSHKHQFLIINMLVNNTTLIFVNKLIK